MSALPTSKCKSCPAKIVWAISPAGRAIPIDANPIPLAMLPDRAVPYSIASVTSRGVQLKPYVSDGGLDVDAAYVSHFTTCPAASAHSKKRTPRRAAPEGL